jgi:hypothetical protein
MKVANPCPGLAVELPRRGSNMQSSAWIALLRHVPPEQQSRFMLVTSSGTEIAIQSFLLVEQECVAVKGRLAGSQDAGRVFFIPYSNIDYFGFQQPVKDTEFTELFGGVTLTAETTPAEDKPEIVQSAAPEPELPPDAPAESPSGQRPAIRSEVLERFRSRVSISSPGAPTLTTDPQRAQP